MCHDSCLCLFLYLAPVWYVLVLRFPCLICTLPFSLHFVELFYFATLF